MARDRRRVDDDSEELESLPVKKRKRGLPVWAITLLIAAPVVVIGSCGGGVLYLKSRYKTVDSMTPREQFKQQVMGKKPDEVRQAVGTPDETSETGNYMTWTYKWRTKDPVTNKGDYRTNVTFVDGVVTGVSF